MDRNESNSEAAGEQAANAHWECSATVSDGDNMAVAEQMRGWAARVDCHRALCSRAAEMEVSPPIEFQSLAKSPGRQRTLDTEC